MNTKRLHELRDVHANKPNHRIPLGTLVESWDALPALLDRLDKLEAVAEAARGDFDVMGEGTQGLSRALAALEEEKV